ncbi:hypothetical protein HWV62_36777 [Athelia sp. TMB]|nr:hypothetical protein HWV62_36777 [Athelia sp. TMB]
MELPQGPQVSYPSANAALAEKQVRDWCFRRYRHIINWAIFNAYNLKHTRALCDDHVFYMRLERRHSNPAPKNAKSMFNIAEAALLTRGELMREDSEVYARFMPSDMDTEARATFGEKRAKTHLYNAMQTVDRRHVWTTCAYWDDEEIRERSEGGEGDESWLAILKSITDGGKEWEIVNGNPARILKNSHLLSGEPLSPKTSKYLLAGA